jgi:hypothetical protein
MDAQPKAALTYLLSVSCRIAAALLLLSGLAASLVLDIEVYRFQSVDLIRCGTDG